MSSQYSTIKAKIKSELETITELEEVYDYKKGDINGYPVACIEEMSGDTTEQNRCNVLRNMNWTIRVYQEMEKDGVGHEEAESRITTIIDKLWNLFDEEWQMDCQVDNAQITNIATGYEEREASMRIIEITLLTIKSYDIC